MNNDYRGSFIAGVYMWQVEGEGGIESPFPTIRDTSEQL